MNHSNVDLIRFLLERAEIEQEEVGELPPSYWQQLKKVEEVLMFLEAAEALFSAAQDYLQKYEGLSVDDQAKLERDIEQTRLRTLKWAEVVQFALQDHLLEKLGEDA